MEAVASFVVSVFYCSFSLQGTRGGVLICNV